MQESPAWASGVSICSFDRGVEHPVEEHRVVVAARAPLRRLRAHRVLHVLDGLAVPLVVEGGEAVGRRAPLLVDLLVAAPALLRGHEEVGRDHPAHVGLGGGGKEGSLRPLALPLHRHGRERGVDDAVLGRRDVRHPACPGGEEDQDRGRHRPGPGTRRHVHPGRPPESGEGQRGPEGQRGDVSVEERAKGSRGPGQEEGHPEKDAQADDHRGPARERRQAGPASAHAGGESGGHPETEDHVEAHVGEVEEPGVGASTEVEAVQAEGDQSDRQDRVTPCHAESPEECLGFPTFWRIRRPRVDHAIQALWADLL